MERPTWKNTLNYNHGIYANLIDVLHAASSVGYPYFSWHDGRIHKVGKEYSSKGVFRNLYAESTEYTIEMLDGDNNK